MEIDEVINAIYSGDADDACERLRAYVEELCAFRHSDDVLISLDYDMNRIPVAAQKAKNARNKP